MNVVLIGFMATGKSTVGRALGRSLDIPFVDADFALQRQNGMTVPEYFAKYGEAAFRQAETDLLKKLLLEQNLPMSAAREFPRRYVLSTGGGAPLRPENHDLLKKLGHVVWLRAKTDTIATRCRPHLSRRPILHGHDDDLEDHIDGLMAVREPIYESLADLMFWTDNDTSPDQLARRIKGAVLTKTRKRA